MTAQAFPLPLIFAAWGFRSGGGAFAGASGLAQLCNNCGIKTVAVNIGNATTKLHRRFNVKKPRDGQPWTTRRDADILRAAGIRVAVWGVANTATAVSELQRLGASEADWLPQVEGPTQRDLVFSQARLGLRVPAIVTNYSGGGDTPGEAQALRECGVKSVFVECYNDAGPMPPWTDLERMLWQGTAYGWMPDELVATMGTYRGEMPDSYTGTEPLGRTFGLYLAEPMIPAQWTAFGELNASAPPTPEEEDVDPITDDQARDSVKTVTQAALSTYADPKPRGRNTLAWRIANAPDGSWNAARDGVKSALDNAGVPDVPA